MAQSDIEAITSLPDNHTNWGSLFRGAFATIADAGLDTIRTVLNSISDAVSDVTTAFQAADSAHAALPVHENAMVQVVWNGTAWVLEGTGEPHTNYDGPKIFLWEAGDPDPTVGGNPAYRDLIVGDGT